MRNNSKNAGKVTQVVAAAQQPPLYGTPLTKTKKAFVLPVGFRYTKKHLYFLQRFASGRELCQGAPKFPDLPTTLLEVLVNAPFPNQADEKLFDKCLVVYKQLAHLAKACELPDLNYLIEWSNNTIHLSNVNTTINQASIIELYNLQLLYDDKNILPLIVIRAILSSHTKLTDTEIWNLCELIYFLFKMDRDFINEVS